MLEVSADVLVVVDEQRLFLVDPETGRRQKRFGEQVLVQAAQPNSKGSRLLLFVELEEQAQLWLWTTATSSFSPLSWLASPQQVTWQPGSEDRVLVLSDALSVTETDSLVEELRGSVQPVTREWGLFRVHLDSSRVERLALFTDEVPEKVFSRKGRVFVEYADQRREELILKRTSPLQKESDACQYGCYLLVKLPFF